MLQNRREKLLGGVLLGIVVLSGGQDAVNAVVFGPLDEKDAQISGLMQKIGDRELEFDRIEHAQRELQPLRSRSLPPDPSVATTLYQNWLIDTARSAGILSAQITPGRAIEEEDTGHRIPVTLQGSMTTTQLGAFLDAFYAAPLLHRVTSVSVTSGNGPRDTQPRVTLALEALALRDAEPRTELSVTPDTTDNGSRKPAHARDSADSARQFFASRDPFRRGYNGPPPPVRTQPRQSKPAPIDPLIHIRLVASFTSGEQTEAWFYDSRTKQQTVVQTGSGFDLAGLQGRLISAGADSIIVEIDGEQRRLPMGQSLKSLQSRT